jgi:citrate synthase
LIIVNVMGELVNARTAAERLGVDVRTLYAYVSRGALRREPGPDGRSSRYDSDELDLLARRSRPRTLPRPAASIDLVIATRVSTVTDGMVRYRGTDVRDLVKAEAPFERVADLLWQAGPSDADGGWKPPGAGEPLAILLPDEIPVLHRFAIAVAAMAGAGPPDVAASDGAVTSIPDWPSCGRRVIGCLIDSSGSAPRSGGHHNNHPDPADQLDPADHLDDHATVAGRLWQRWSPLPPTAARVRALDIALVLLAEHELALSTLSVRVAASARAAPAGCLLAGLSTLSGSLHGGAARTVHDKLAEGEPVITGFGHPVHRHGDPRVTPLLEAVSAVATDEDRALIETASRQPPRPLNVDFALGALTYAARMPAEAATAIFAIARVAGWIAHAAEEYAEPPLRFRGRAVRPARGGLRPPSGG